MKDKIQILIINLQHSPLIAVKPTLQRHRFPSVLLHTALSKQLVSIRHFSPS